MANTLTEVTDKLLAQGLVALRQNSVMPLLVNRGYDRIARERGSTIDIPIPSAITVQTVSPAATPPSTADVAPTKATIALSEWKEAPFYLTDKERTEIMEGTVPMQATEAIKALANDVDTYIMGKYLAIYGYTGTAGTAPFATDVTDATAIRKILNNQLAPMGDRRVVFNPDAEANALNLRAFHDMSFSGSAAGILEGEVNRKFGMDWFMDQNVVTHTAGTGTGYLVNDGAGLLVGATTATVDTGTGSLIVGDIVTFAGHAQTYVVTSALAANVFGFLPALKAAVANDGAITKKAAHAVNLAFHRDAFAFASVPLETEPGSEQLGSVIRAAVDPISGLALRLEVTREHKRIRYSYDILYGASLVRPELATRLAG
jgi:hypothetical protein